MSSILSLIEKVFFWWNNEDKVLIEKERSYVIYVMIKGRWAWSPDKAAASEWRWGRETDYGSFSPPPESHFLRRAIRSWQVVEELQHFRPERQQNLHLEPKCRRSSPWSELALKKDLNFKKSKNLVCVFRYNSIFWTLCSFLVLSDCWKRKKIFLIVETLSKK